jgi:homoserine dehydrogenase
MTAVKPVRVGLLGCGTVGGGVVKLLRRNAAMLAAKLGARIELAGVADRSLRPDPALGLGADLITRDAHALVKRPDIDLVVELFGGYEPAQSLILQALAAGKDVVTANKALLAEHGDRIFKAAARNQRFIGFEASVGGGIPIIRTLREALAGDRQRAVYGIVNGTCNFILTTMAEHGAEFADVLAEAQRSGLAEADPSLDVGGHDAAHKLCLLVTLAFGVALKPRQVHTEGITHITQQDIAYARELGFTIKLLAIAKNDDGAIEARVHPTMVPSRHLLAGVGGAFNAIYIQGEALGSTMYFGLGAGEMPTATAVVADILEVARMRLAGASGASDWALGYPIARIKAAKVKPMDRVVCQYYLRFMAEDKPGVLGRIASVLGRHRISIASVIQQERAPQVRVPVVMRSHEAEERALKLALAEIRRQRIVKTEPVFIRIEERL